MLAEPLLTQEDLDIWGAWRRAALVHSRTRRHSVVVDRSRGIAARALESASNWAAMWSGGKDSTAMAHLLIGVDSTLELVSEKDDLDYPGEREYVESLACQWGGRLRVVVPSVSPSAWMSEHAARMDHESDMHSRSAALSKACFYGVVERAVGPRPIFLGLRKDESRGRMLNRTTHGAFYHKRSGQTVCTPIVDWSGLDVLAYLSSRDIPVLDVYRCVAFMHRDEPWRLRKSWWIPGSNGRHGGVAWLRHYYPSLFQRLCEWMPDARLLS